MFHVPNYFRVNYYILFFLPPLLVNPFVVKGFFSSKPHVCMFLKQIRDKVFSFTGYILPLWTRKIKCCLGYVLENFIIIFARKRWSTTEHYIHNYTHRPRITLACIAAFQHLWSYIVRRPVRGSHQLILRNFLSKAKVDQFYNAFIVFSVQQKVFRFNVST